MTKVKLFSATWCSNCKPVKSVLTTLEGEGLITVDSVDIDTPEGMELAQEFSVKSIPTVVFEDNTRFSGMVTEADVRSIL